MQERGTSGMGIYLSVFFRYMQAIILSVSPWLTQEKRKWAKKLPGVTWQKYRSKGGPAKSVEASRETQ